MLHKDYLEEMAEIRATLAILRDHSDEVSSDLRRAETVPRDWDHLNQTAPTSPKKCKLTVSLDADLVDWYRSLGRGYQRHMNGVLRGYMRARQDGVLAE